MKKYIEITDVVGREVLDSRGNPTVEVEVYAMDAEQNKLFMGRAAVPPAPPPAFLKPASCGTKIRAAIWAKASPRLWPLSTPRSLSA